MENLNIALIGCGMIGREHIERIQNRIRNARIVAVCDVFEEGAKKGAEIAGAGTKVYTDFNEAINDPDVNAVVVTTPGQFHKGPVLAAIKAGKPVFSEKPLANTAARRSLRPRWQAASTSYRLASCAVTTAATVRLRS